MKPPYAIGSVPSLSGHAVAYRWRSLPRVRWHRASKPQGSSERVLPWQITMDQLIFASLSHTHYWYEVGMLKVGGIHTICVLCVCCLVQTVVSRYTNSTEMPGEVLVPSILHLGYRYVALLQACFWHALAWCSDWTSSRVSFRTRNKL